MMESMKWEPNPMSHDFKPVAGHPDDDECTDREDGTDATYCGLPKDAHAYAGELRCLCDGGAYGQQKHPFLVHPECPVHPTNR